MADNFNINDYYSDYDPEEIEKLPLSAETKKKIVALRKQEDTGEKINIPVDKFNPDAMPKGADNQPFNILVPKFNPSNMPQSAITTPEILPQPTQNIPQNTGIQPNQILPAKSQDVLNPFAESQRLTNEAYNKQIEANNKAASAAIQSEKEKVGLFKDLQATMQSAQNQAAQAEAKRQEILQKQNEELQKSIDDFRGQKVDAGKFMNQSTGNKILAAISMGLGAMGASMTKQPNYALEIIQNSINNDIAAQKANIDQTGNLVNAKRGIISDLRQRFGDERQAEAAQRMMYLDNTKMQIEQLAAGTKSKEVQANAQNMIAGIELAKAKANMEFNVAAQQYANKQKQPDIVKQIAIIPDSKMQEKAYGELGVYKQKEAAIKRVNALFDQAHTMDPRTLGEVQNALAIEATNLYGTRGKSLFEDFSPGKLTTPSKVEEMRERVITAIKGKYETPTLDSYGITPKELELQKAIKGGTFQNKGTSDQYANE